MTEPTWLAQQVREYDTLTLCTRTNKTPLSLDSQKEGARNAAQILAQPLHAYTNQQLSVCVFPCELHTLLSSFLPPVPLELVGKHVV